MMGQQDWRTVAWQGQQRDAMPVSTGDSRQLRREPEHETEGELELEKPDTNDN